MITPGDLYEEIHECQDIERLRQIAHELLGNAHRLRSLVEAMATFRGTQEHERAMGALKRFQKQLEKR